MKKILSLILSVSMALVPIGNICFAQEVSSNVYEKNETQEKTTLENSMKDLNKKKSEPTAGIKNEEVEATTQEVKNIGTNKDKDISKEAAVRLNELNKFEKEQISISDSYNSVKKDKNIIKSLKAPLAILAGGALVALAVTRNKKASPKNLWQEYKNCYKDNNEFCKEALTLYAAGVEASNTFCKEASARYATSAEVLNIDQNYSDDAVKMKTYAQGILSYCRGSAIEQCEEKYKKYVSAKKRKNIRNIIYSIAKLILAM